jgi:uncharacterized integral membrane protein
MKNIHIHRWGWVIVFCISLLPLLDLFHPGLPVTHDGQDHVARIANFYQSLSEGNPVPRWGANLNWGYGHPVLMFLYPFSSYTASFFHMMGFSFVDSTKLVFALAYIASILSMYLWAGSVWGTIPGVVAAVLYGFAPYRFVDLYVRGAIGEHMAFVFLPLILWGLSELKKDRTSLRGPLTIAVGTAALILSHNALSIMFLPLVALYALYVFLYDGKRQLDLLLASAAYVGMGFLFSVFFWAPAFLEGKYTLRDIVTAGQFDGRFVPWSWFVYSPWSYGGSDMLSKSLGWAQLAVIAFAVMYCLRRNKFRILLAGILSILLISLSIMTQASSGVWSHISLLQKFQFPWRFLSVSVFASAVIGGLVIALAGKKRMVIAIAVCALAVLGTVHMWHAREYKIYPETFYTGIYRGTTDTGESSPIWSIRFMEHEASSSMSLISGDASIAAQVRTTTRHTYHVTAKIGSRLVDNTLYFPGWNVLVDRTPVTLQFQDPRYRGLMTFTVLPGTHTVDVVFTDTKIRKGSNAVSLISVVLFTIILGTMPLWRRKK